MKREGLTSKTSESLVAVYTQHLHNCVQCSEKSLFDMKVVFSAIDSFTKKSNCLFIRNAFSKISFICDARKDCVNFLQNKKIEYIVKNRVDYRKHTIVCLL